MGFNRCVDQRTGLTGVQNALVGLGFCRPPQRGRFPLSEMEVQRGLQVADFSVHAMGPAAEVLTAEMVHAVFGLEAIITPDPVSGKPMMLPLGRHARRTVIPVEQPNERSV